MSSDTVAHAVTAVERGDAATAKHLLEIAFAALAELTPRDVQLTCFHLGNMHLRKGDFVAAEQVLRAGVAQVPSSEPLAINLGGALIGQGREADATAVLQAAAEHNPGSATLQARLGYAMSSDGQIGAAHDAYCRSLVADPAQPMTLNQAGNNLLSMGEAGDAVLHFRRSLELRRHAKTASNRLLALHYTDEATPAELRAEHLAWARTYTSDLPRFDHVNAGTEQDRPLRIGYVSPDLRQHSVASFIEPVLRSHDRSRFRVHCYADVKRPDEVTARLRELSDHWVDASTLSDDALAQRIFDDRINILVDLAGHTARHRLLVFARRPAPVQVSWLGYPDSTGLAEIDYRLTDELADPVGSEQPGQTLWRLPAPFLCYGMPQQPQSEAVTPERPFTFGSFNDIAKLSPRCVAVWAEILRAAPDARLLLKSAGLQDPSVAKRVRERFAEHGIAPERIDLRGRIDSAAGHLAFYREVDVGLDTFPYAGTTTTCEALAQGVPVLTLLGDRHAHRVGKTLLHAVGLQDLVVEDTGSYIALALELYRSPASLEQARDHLSQGIAHTPLADSTRFTQAFESAMQTIWSERQSGIAGAG